MGKILAVAFICLLLGLTVSGSLDSVATAVTSDVNHYPGLGQGNNVPTMTQLQDLDSPANTYRWLNVADQAYSATYQSSYDYTQATVQVNYETSGLVLQGTLNASNLKPNFAYQLKLLGTPGTTGANERIGLAGRWWQEEWDGAAWVNGQNLNNKGSGSSPNPNDQTYYSRRDIADPTSPTGKKYRYTGYMLFDYFITDDSGNASLSFKVDSSYHVLFKTSQRARTSSDGPLKTTTFDPYISPAYDVDYGASTVSIFGEWERLPVGGVHLQSGDYACQIMLTEESFHGSCVNGSCELAGNWAAAMGAGIQFNISSPLTLTLAINPSSGGSTSPSVGNSFYYTQNQVVTVRAIPKTGYRFLSWTGEVANPSLATTTVTMDSNKTVTANLQYTGSPTPTPIPPAGTEEEVPTEGCFIATAAYGSYLDSHVDTLRSFRDQYLETNPIGSAFVSLYYKVSPPMAAFIDEHPTLKPIVRAGLMPAVAMSSVALNTTLAEKAVILVAIALFTAVLIMWLRQRARRLERR
jgi:hypothetical protein